MNTYVNIYLHIDSIRYVQLASNNQEDAHQALQQLKSEWDALLKSEHVYALNPSHASVVHKMRWRKHKAIRMLYLMAEATNWELSPGLKAYVIDMFKGLPDTKVIEDTHQKLRDLQRENRNFVSNRVKRMFSCMTSGQLDLRHTKVIQPVDEKLVQASWRKLSKTKIRHRTQTRGLKLTDHTLQMLMHPKTEASTTPEGLFHMAAATEWHFHYWKLPAGTPCTLDQSWQSILLMRFDIVKHKPTTKVLMVMAPSDFAFQAWPMVQLNGDSPQDAWAMQVQVHQPLNTQ